MSEPGKKKRTSKRTGEAGPKPEAKEKALKPVDAPPFATVQVRHDGRTMQRRARGYSLGEVAKANLNIGLARTWGLLVDDRRRSVLEGNVSSLGKWAPQSQKVAEEKVEGEIHKLEREVEEEVRKVKEEAKKVEEEAKKVEEEVVKKVEAPIKKRTRKKAVPRKDKKTAKETAD